MTTAGEGLATYCGLYCGACAIKNGEINGAASTLKQMLEVYEYRSWAPLLAEIVPATKHFAQFEGVLEWLTQQDCPGCLGGGGNPDCAIRLCAKERGLTGCWDCADEAGCEKLAPIDSFYSVASENRRHIKTGGLDGWLAEQAASCAAGFSYLKIRQAGGGKD